MSFGGFRLSGLVAAKLLPEDSVLPLKHRALSGLGTIPGIFHRRQRRLGLAQVAALPVADDLPERAKM